VNLFLDFRGDLPFFLLEVPQPPLKTPRPLWEEKDTKTSNISKPMFLPRGEWYTPTVWLFNDKDIAELPKKYVRPSAALLAAADALALAAR
jgi:hypothetical protein